MKTYLFVVGILGAFTAGLLVGSNAQPILVGAGGTPANSIQWPATSPHPSISAPSGALTLASGGTNQNVVLAPSGSGTVNANGYLGFGGLFSALSGGHLKGDAGLFATLPQTTIAIEDTDAAAGGGSGGRITRLMGQRFASYLTTNITTTDGTNWNLDKTGSGGTVLYMDTGGNVQISTATAGANPRALTTRATINATGLGVPNAPSYAVDATGDVNASGVFRKGGTAGTGGNTLFTVCTSGACTTSCTLQFNGGIRVGGTCQ